eukprot:Gb_03867 [translate_table: standard]
MEITRLENLSAFSTKYQGQLKNRGKQQRQYQLISLGGDSRGIGSLLSSKKLVGKLVINEIGGRNGVLRERGHLVVVNNCSRYENLKPGANNALPPSLGSSSELSSERVTPLRKQILPPKPDAAQAVEEFIEKAIFNCRFLTLLAVAGSLAGSLLCFLKGCAFVFDSFKEYFQSFLGHHGSGKVVLMLVGAVDVYLMGTVMLIFGMGLYELFVNSLGVPDRTCTPQVSRATVCGSNLFGLFKLQERPKWLEIQSLDELKTKLGHVIVMVLLVGMFEKSKKVPINCGLDLICFSGSILFSSGCLFLLSKLNSAK